MLIFSCSTWAQESLISSSNNSAGKLPWVIGSLPENSTKFNYKVIEGQSTNLSDAKKSTISTLAFELGTESGVKISSETISNIQEQISNNESSFDSDFKETIKIAQKGFEVSFSKVDEYYELIKANDGSLYYRVWILYSIGTKSRNTPKINYTTYYGWDAGLKSAIIPGWGQLFKKNKKKGVIFMAGAAGSLGFYLYSQNKYKYNINRLEESSSLDIKLEYSSRADKFNSYKNISLGAAAVVWIWSIVDAVSTDGAPKYTQRNFNFDVVSGNNQEIALSFKYNFN